jgi:hypothetical protein
MNNNIGMINDHIQKNRVGYIVYGESFFPPVGRIVCKDGFSLSIQANEYAYCSPRDNNGPWYDFECGFPNREPILEVFKSYAENPANLTETVYAYVPEEVILSELEQHGGVDEEATAKSILEQNNKHKIPANCEIIKTV